MGAIEGVGTYQLLEEVEGLIVHDGDMVGVPAYGARHMEHQLGHVHEQGADEVGHILGLLVVAGIDGVHLLAGGAIGGVEIM